MSQISPRRAVLFDCDGVLVDSEPHAWGAWRDVLGPIGVVVGPSDEEQLTGRPFADIYRFFAEANDLPSSSEVERLLLEATLTRFRRSLRAFRDVVPALRALAERRVPMAVATSSSRVRLDATLELAGLGDWFVVSTAADEVARGKPAPDLYLEAARQLGVVPAECLVVEDTLPGAEAGKRAGAEVVVIRRAHNATTDFEGFRVVDSLSLAVLGG